ncbi:Vegetative incompatibility protein HET-E-1 [Ceratobasidium sp. AG-Ba]|nr:Vegetative incompatibility protein HET-E-1 [Ceratobasidium sp. AG-Ba]
MKEESHKTKKGTRRRSPYPTEPPSSSSAQPRTPSTSQTLAVPQGPTTKTSDYGYTSPLYSNQNSTSTFPLGAPVQFDPQSSRPSTDLTVASPYVNIPHATNHTSSTGHSWNAGPTVGNQPNLGSMVQPVPPAVQQTHQRMPAWGGLRKLMNIIEAVGRESIGPLESVRSDLERCIEVFEEAAKNKRDYEMLRVEINRVLHQLCEYLGADMPPVLTPSIVSLAKGLEAEVVFAIRKMEKNGIGRFLNTSREADEIMQCQNRVRGLLERLALNANVNIWKTVDELATDARLRRLPFSEEAKYNSAESENLYRGRCTTNTRTQLLEELYAWASAENGQRVYWLNGMAGTGKTTIAYSLCEYLESFGNLAASFFCSRQVPSCRNVNRIVPTISYQLSGFSRPFRHAVSAVLENEMDVHNQPLLKQFESLVMKPLSKIHQTLPTSLVIVIDALDECENSEAVGRILEVLLSHAGALSVKIFVASRPDSKILAQMRSQAGGRIPRELRLHELESSVVQTDIALYLKQKLQALMPISVQEINAIAARSGVLFIYAATIVRYIERAIPARRVGRLREVLNKYHAKIGPTKPDEDIDKLYSVILGAALYDEGLGQNEQLEMRLVLHTIICAQEPLSTGTLAGLLGLDSELSVLPALQSLLSVLQISEANGVVNTLHESFPDFLLDQKRSGELFCDPEENHGRLARLCFGQIFLATPSFNICNLKSSYMLDDEVEGLNRMIQERISGELLYACRYWGAHLQHTRRSSERFDLLLRFLSTRLLLWMEVMNLTKLGGDGLGVLYDVKRWCEGEKGIEYTLRLLQDSWEFVGSFNSFPVQRSTPHIYISHLAYWSPERPVAMNYRLEEPLLVAGSSTAIGARATRSACIIRAGNAIECVALSPDGAYIVSGSWDKTVRIWDSRTGQPVGQPLHGHTQYVTSVAYSPDGAYILSGSDDRTVRIWDSRTGQPVGQPLHGHTDTVTSVAYSPDGAYIVSGSGDETVRIWDSRTGQPVGQPLRGHTGAVNSVAYSPDGAYIVSGSEDRTVRIWDSRTGQPVGQPLHGHTRGVNSVAYSPDGAYIFSDDWDRKRHVWSSHTGLLVSVSVSPVDRSHVSPDEAITVSAKGADLHVGRTTFHVTDLPTLSIEDSTSSMRTSALIGAPFTHICNSCCELKGPHRPWSLDNNGWVALDGSIRLAWIPPDLRNVLLYPDHKLIISRRGSLHLEFTSGDVTKVGENWANYFRPRVEYSAA